MKKNIWLSVILVLGLSLMGCEDSSSSSSSSSDELPAEAAAVYAAVYAAYGQVFADVSAEAAKSSLSKFSPISLSGSVAGPCGGSGDWFGTASSSGMSAEWSFNSYCSDGIVLVGSAELYTTLWDPAGAGITFVYTGDVTATGAATGSFSWNFTITVNSSGASITGTMTVDGQVYTINFSVSV